MKSLRRLVIASAITFLLLTPVPFIMNTEAGLQFIFQMIVRLTPGQLSVETLQGTLSGPIRFSNIRYKNESIDIQLQKGQLHWRPRNMLIGFLRIKQLTIDGISVKMIPGEQENSSELPQVELPFDLSVDGVQLNDVNLFNNESQILQLNSLSFGVTTFRKSFNIPWLIATSPDFELSTHGKIKPLGNYPTKLQSSIIINNLFSQSFTVDTEFKGNLQRLNTVAEVRGFVNGSIKGDLLDVVSNMHWDLMANVQTLSLQSFAKDMPANNISGSFRSQGSLNEISFSGNAFSYYENLGDLIVNYDLALIDNELKISKLNLREKQRTTELQGQGSINWAGEEVSYRLISKWQNAVWPWNDTEQVKSKSGEILFDGTLSNYELGLSGEVQLLDYPKMQLTSSAHGNLQQLNLDKFTLNALQGEVKGKGILHWQDTLGWQLELDFAEINPGVLAQDWPGKIYGKLSSSGLWQDDNLVAELSLVDIGGELNNKALTGFGKYNIRNEKIYIESTHLSIDGTKLTAHGEINNQLDLKYSIQSENLGALIAEASGRLHVNGRIRGLRNKPQIILNVKGDDLAFENVSLKNVKGKIDLSLASEQKSNMLVEVKQIQVNDFSLDKIKLTADGTTMNHQISLDVFQGKNMADWKLSGSYTDNLWQANLTNSLLKLDHLGVWQLEKRSDISLVNNNLMVERNCYVQQKTKVCFDVMNQPTNFIANVDWIKLPLDRFASLMPRDIKANALLEGNIALNLKDGVLNANAKIANSAGDLKIVDDETEYLFPFQAGKSSLDWNANAIKVNVLIPLQKEAAIAANLTVNQKNKDLDLLQQSVSGDINLKTDSLILLAPFLPTMQGLDKANADIQVKIAGKLAQPKFNGYLNVRSDQLDIPMLNISLKNTRIKATANNQGLINFNAMSESGPGDIQFSGNVALMDDGNWQAQIQIQGERFTVVDLPEATVNINPSLKTNIQQELVTIEGDLLIPYARLRPKKLPDTAIGRSADVVILDKEKPHQTKKDQWQMDSKIRIILGDRVSFDGFGLRSRLVGNILLIDEPNTITLGRGEINLVDGYYRTFGQELEISRGRFIFANTPVDDPGLDVRAQRKIGDIITGVNVTSTLRKPEVRLFSEPTMAEADVLSYLLLGRPLRQANQGEGSQLMTAAQAMGLAGSELLARNIGNRLGIDEILIETSTDTGSSSLVIGRYLSPRLYIRYLTGIFERSNIVQLRYDVSKKVILQTETGSQMGADVFYTIEH